MNNSIEILGIVLALFLSFLFTFFSVPKIMEKMKKADLYGIDVNKKDKPKIPEMGGIGGVLGFSLGITITLGIIKLVDTADELPVLVAISVLGIAAFIGLMDDISILGRKEKAWLIIFASLPLVISQIGDTTIDLIVYQIEFQNTYHLFFWIILVPLGITGSANAMNMSAGYNGLESGQMVIISFTLLVISILRNVDISVSIVFGGVTGVMMALYYFNKFPAKTFVGDVGTLGFGAVIGAGVIMSGLIIFAIICIIPTFYELYATIKYKLKGIERREACMNPIVLEDGKIIPPEGSEDYTLAYYVLSFKPLSEKKLVNMILAMYILFGALSIILSLTN